MPLISLRRILGVRSMDKKYVLSMDIGGTNLRMGIVDNTYNMVVFERVPCPKVLGDRPLENLIEATKDFLRRTEMGGKIEAMAVGLPGAVAQDHSFVYSVPNLNVADNTDWGGALSEALGIPVFIERDVNHIIVHDIIKNQLDPEKNRTILGFYLGTGLGNAMYINGKLYVGKHGVASELGHIPLYGVNAKCTCGRNNCTEILVSGRHLAELTKREFPDCSIGEVFLKHGQDERLLQFVRDAALPIATEITLLDPDYIILGGGVIEMPGFPIEMLKAEITQNVRQPLPAADLHFIVDKDFQEKGVLGGGIMTLERLGISTIE